MPAEQTPLTEIVCWTQPMSYVSRAMLHTHPFGEFYLCLRDTGWQHTPGDSVTMRPGDLFYFPPRSPHIGSGPPGRTGEAVVLYLPEELFAPSSPGDDEALHILQFLGQLVSQTSPRISLSAASKRTIRATLLGLTEELRHARPGCRCAAKSRVQSLLLTIARDRLIPADLLQQFLQPRRTSRLTNACRYMETGYMHPLRVDQLAAMSGLSQSQFHAVFKREMGCTCIRYLTRLRLGHAAALIRQSEHSITRIAGDCGFPCLSHFYHVFKTRFGVSPRKLRAQSLAAAAA